MVRIHHRPPRRTLSPSRFRAGASCGNAVQGEAFDRRGRRLITEGSGLSFYDEEAPQLPAVTACRTWCAVAALFAVSCGAAPFNPPPADYSTDVVLTIGDKTVEYSGQGLCYAAATLFTYGLTMTNGDNLGFSVTMDVGQHRIDGGDTALYLRPESLDVQRVNGSITVNHWNTRDRADGELAGTGPSIAVRGHWGCRFGNH